jgi:hypothetical protein
MTTRRRRRWKHPSRDLVLFVFGILGILYETVFDNVERPSLLVVFAGCVGLPAFLRTDEARHTEDDPEDERPPPAPSKVETK